MVESIRMAIWMFAFGREGEDGFTGWLLGCSVFCAKPDQDSAGAAPSPGGAARRALPSSPLLPLNSFCIVAMDSASPARCLCSPPDRA